MWELLIPRNVSEQEENTTIWTTWGRMSTITRSLKCWEIGHLEITSRFACKQFNSFWSSVFFDFFYPPPPQTKFRGVILEPACPSLWPPVCRHDFVQTCSERLGVWIFLKICSVHQIFLSWLVFFILQMFFQLYGLNHFVLNFVTILSS